MTVSVFADDAASLGRTDPFLTVIGRETALAVLVRIADLERALNYFTFVLRDFALAQADAVDRAVAAGDDPGLSPVLPFVVKNLFDVVGVTTLAGPKIHAAQPPATRDATAMRRLRQYGAALVGALNMDEYAYGFTTEKRIKEQRTIRMTWKEWRPVPPAGRLQRSRRAASN